MASAHRYPCPRCDFGADSPDELAAHDLIKHGLDEVPASQLPPLPAVPGLQAQAERAVAQLRCGRSGHIPNPLNPAVCIACGSALEVLRG